MSADASRRGAYRVTAPRVKPAAVAPLMVASGMPIASRVPGWCSSRNCHCCVVVVVVVGGEVDERVLPVASERAARTTSVDIVSQVAYAVPRNATLLATVPMASAVHAVFLRAE